MLTANHRDTNDFVNQRAIVDRSGADRPKLRHGSHGGAKFSCLKSGSKPSERHGFTSLTCFGGWSAEGFFACFVLRAFCFAALALRSRGSSRWRRSNIVMPWSSRFL